MIETSIRETKTECIPSNTSIAGKLFTGNSNQPLAYKIADLCHTSMGNADVTKFSDGEIRIEIHDHVRGAHAFIIQSTCTPANDCLMELLIMSDALKRSDVEKVTAVVPYYGYARQDRRPAHTRTPITSRLVAKMMEGAGIDQVIIVDLHSGQQQGFFDIPVINISAAPEIVTDIWQHRSKENNIVVVSPDTGGVVRARVVAKQLNDADLAIVDKRRPSANESQVMNIIGDVDGRNCIIVDDMIDTAGTLCKAAKALKEKGANKVYAYATHGIFSGNAFDNINTSVIDEVVVTDTIPQHNLHTQSDKVRIVSMAPLLAETMSRITQNKSISELYDGYDG